jgi:beta-N-acetylhexosaminidase
VVDILPQKGESFIGSRSFGNNAEIVSTMSAAIANGLEDNGIIATYKHFPGHGDTATDSHTTLPVLKKTQAELFSDELIPFQNAIKNNCKVIMIGHIALPEIVGDTTPASLSKEIVTDLLKNQMGFDGLVVTDALNMGALTNEYSYEEIYVKSINAGVDLLLMPNGSKAAIEIIKKNVSEERINESVRKILTFKYTYLDDENVLDKSFLGSKEHKKVLDKISY